jgi:hypothetical protein
MLVCAFAFLVQAVGMVHLESGHQAALAVEFFL